MFRAAAGQRNWPYMGVALMNESLPVLRSERDRFVGFSFAAADLLLEVSNDLVIRYATGAGGQLTGKPNEGLIGLPFCDLFDIDDRRTVAIMLGGLADNARLNPVMFRLANNMQTVSLGACCLETGKGALFVTLTKLPGGVADITAEGPPDSKRDVLTGALGKQQFSEAAGAALAKARAEGLNPEMSLLELSGLSDVGAAVAPGAVGRLLKDVGNRLRGNSLGGDLAGYLGGDKFGLLHDENVSAVSIQDELAQLVAESPLAEAVTVQSTSVALDGGGLDEAEISRAILYTVNKYADSEDGDFDITTLSGSLDSLISETVDRYSELKTMVANQDFEVHFQPILSLGTRELHHYEALSRLKDGGSPFETVTFAEQIGAVEDFDLAVSRQVIGHLEEALLVGNRVSAAINISANSMENQVFISVLRKLFAECDVPPKQILLEITESASISNYELVGNVIGQLRDDGHEICLDDFGAGETSFNYLRQFPVDHVKIDGCYIREICDNQRDQSFVRAIASLCRDLDIETVAEMIEDEGQAKLVHDFGVTYGQGYLFGRAVAGFAGGGECEVIQAPTLGLQVRSGGG